MYDCSPSVSTLALILSLSLTFGGRAEVETSPHSLPADASNLDFEAPALEPAWQIADPSTGYRAERSTRRVIDGRASGSIYRPQQDAGQHKTQQGSAGILQQRLDATAYRGQIVRLRAHLSAEGPQGTSARLYLQARTGGGGPGAFGVTVTGPAETASAEEVQWRQDLVVLEVPEEAKHLQFGVLLRGEGRAWIDAVELDALGPPSAVYAPPRTLTPRGADNLMVFARLAGIVRHFHAGDATLQTDWPALLRHYLAAVETASDGGSLRRTLEQAFAPLVPRLLLFAGNQAQERPAADEERTHGAPPPARAWLHKGIATGTAVSARHFQSERVDPEAFDLEALGSNSLTAPLSGFPQPGEPYIFELGAGLRVSLPLSVREQTNEAEWVQAPIFPAPAVPPSARDRTVRLANVIEVWNLIQHSFPYFDRLSGLDASFDWGKSLRQALQAAALDGSDGDSEAEFADTLRRLLVDLHDAHAEVSYLGDFSLRRLPLTWRWLQDKLIVTSVGPSATELLAVGDIIQRIDGRPVVDALEQARTLVSAATPGHRLFRALDHLALCTVGTSVSLLLTPGEFQRQVQLPCDTQRYGHGLESAVRPDTIADVTTPGDLAPGDWGLVYLDLDRLDDATFNEALPRLQAARGLIFDLRGYPARISAALLQHLISKPFTLAPTKFPLYTFPDQLAVRWQQKSFTLDPKAPHLDAPCVVLTDGRAISRAETFLAFFADAGSANTGRCTIVGETSGGTNGEVNSAALAGGFQVFWTGSRVDRRDGSPHFGIGIQPEIEVVPTVGGIREGRDEVLEAGVAWLASQVEQE